MKFQSSLVIIACLLATQASKAGMSVEPFLGLEVGSLESQTSLTGSQLNKFDLSGAVGGARIISGGTDYYGGVEVNLGVGSANRTTNTPTRFNTQRTTASLLAGMYLGSYQIHIGYSPLNRLACAASIGDVTFTGNAIKLSANYKGWDKAALNFEYTRGSYDKLEGSGGTLDLSGTSHSLQIGIVFPL